MNGLCNDQVNIEINECILKPQGVGATPESSLKFPRAPRAAKSCQSCPTLYNPTDGSPPGSAIPGILQARILEWVEHPIPWPQPRRLTEGAALGRRWPWTSLVVLRPHRVTCPTVHIHAPGSTLVQASWGQAGPVCSDTCGSRGGPCSCPCGPVSLTPDLLLEAAQHWLPEHFEIPGKQKCLRFLFQGPQGLSAPQEVPCVC